MVSVGFSVVAVIFPLLFSPTLALHTAPPGARPAAASARPAAFCPGPLDCAEFGRGQWGLSAYAAVGHPVLGSQDYGFSEGQCTWFVAAAAPAAQNPCGKGPGGRNAGRWLSLARVQGLPIGDQPLPGAIVCMSAGGCGHVAIVLGVNETSLTIADANWHDPEDGRVRVHQVSRNRGDILGYIFGRNPPPALPATLTPAPAPALVGANPFPTQLETTAPALQP
jgi:surface antigen